MKNKPKRIALYSHDAMGVGHLRRNLRIASALCADLPEVSVLLISGACEANYFSMPSGVDCLALPGLRKSNGGYAPRRLKIESERLNRLRSSVIEAALTDFAPDVFVVDKLPRGVDGELEQILTKLASSKSCRSVLGLRDILDDASSVRSEWDRESYDSFSVKHYDEVWIYGDQTVYDAVSEYQFSPALAAKCHYVGYVDPRSYDGSGKLGESLQHLIRTKFALCMCGGGEDGFEMCKAFASAKRPKDLSGVILTGPHMPESQQAVLRTIASREPDSFVIPFCSEPMSLMRHADRIVCMGGYNSVCEALSTDVPSLVIPRTSPRMEQAVRASTLSKLGLVDTAACDGKLEENISNWLSQAKPRAIRNMNFGALDRITERLAGRAEICAEVHLPITPRKAHAC